MALMDFLKKKRDEEPKMTQELWFSIVGEAILKGYDELVAAVGRKPDAEGISQMGAMMRNGSTEYVWNFGPARGTATIDKDGKMTSFGYYPDGYTTGSKDTDFNAFAEMVKIFAAGQKPNGE